uniref:Uncharacterized protein n=1 Tax=viral metagenome TaxID=1070528 RepID=A0A6M3L979_9ZZZZ
MEMSTHSISPPGLINRGEPMKKEYEKFLLKSNVERNKILCEKMKDYFSTHTVADFIELLDKCIKETDC